MYYCVITLEFRGNAVRSHGPVLGHQSAASPRHRILASIELHVFDAHQNTSISRRVSGSLELMAYSQLRRSVAECFLTSVHVRIVLRVTLTQRQDRALT